MKIVYNTFTDDLDYVGEGSGPGGDDLHVARFIVSAGVGNDGANYGSIASAYAAAVAAGGKQTVFVQPGTYNENISLTSNVNLTTFSGEGFSNNTIINGKITSNITGACSITGFYLENASDNILSITNTSDIDLVNCFINVNGHDAISVTAAANLSLDTCQGNMASAHKFFNITNSDTANIFDGINITGCYFGNGSGITTASTISAGQLIVTNSNIFFPITSSGTSSVKVYNSWLDTSGINSTSSTIGGSGSNSISNTTVNSGTASAISIGGTCSVQSCSVSSSNTNSITGVGTLKYAFIAFTGTSSTVNTSTQTALATLI